MTHDHAAAQKRYAASKSKTHKRVCVYIPKKHVEEFKTFYKRLEAKWEKE